MEAIERIKSHESLTECAGAAFTRLPPHCGAAACAGSLARPLLPELVRCTVSRFAFEQEQPRGTLPYETVAAAAAAVVAATGLCCALLAQGGAAESARPARDYAAARRRRAGCRSYGVAGG